MLKNQKMFELGDRFFKFNEKKMCRKKLKNKFFETFQIPKIYKSVENQHTKIVNAKMCKAST